MNSYDFPYVQVGVRDFPYGICCPWVRGGWDLDALEKFFRRRRRRRRRRLAGSKYGCFIIWLVHNKGPGPGP